MLHVPGVFTREEVREFRRQLDAADWTDGRATVGEQGALVKANRQLDAASPLTLSLGATILQRLANHPLFFSAALPLRVLPPMFNRYSGGGHYGDHVDGAVMKQRGSAQLLRSDVSCTLFLCEPEEYEGGELVVKDTYGEHEAKLPAGDLLLYPSTSLHHVRPVTTGTRTCSFFWVQSLVREDARRTQLFELDQLVQSLRGKLGETPETVGLTAHYHNLLRLWAET